MTGSSSGDTYDVSFYFRAMGSEMRTVLFFYVFLGYFDGFLCISRKKLFYSKACITYNLSQPSYCELQIKSKLRNDGFME